MNIRSMVHRVSIADSRTQKRAGSSVRERLRQVLSDAFGQIGFTIRGFAVRTCLAGLYR